MAEAVAALSLAANILQMVEYAGVFVTTACKIYSSRADTPLDEDSDRLRSHTREVKKILGSLEQNESDSSAVVGLRDRDRDLLNLAAESRKVIGEILDSLKETENPTSWRKALQAALKSTWNNRRIARLQTKLDGVRSQLTLHLVHSMRCVCNNV